MSIARLLAVLSLTVSLWGQESPWFLDFAKAKAAAKEKNLQILTYFTGSDWNKYCQRYHEDVFSQKDFLDWAEKNVILLEVDTPRDRKLDAAIVEQNEGLKKTYQITGLPTVLFLDSEGKIVVRMNGLTSGGPKAFFKEATKQGFGRAVTGESKGKDGEKGADGKSGEAAKETEIKPRNPADRPVWMANYTDALVQAKRQNKIVLAAFVGSDWCQWCQKLEDEVFTKPEFKKWAEKNMILLELDFPEKTPLSEDLKKQNQKLKEDFKIEDFPRILFINGVGKVIGRSAYMPGGPAAWIKSADALLKKARGG